VEAADGERAGSIDCVIGDLYLEDICPLDSRREPRLAWPSAGQASYRLAVWTVPPSRGQIHAVIQLLVGCRVPLTAAISFAADGGDTVVRTKVTPKNLLPKSARL